MAALGFAAIPALAQAAPKAAKKATAPKPAAAAPGPKPASGKALAPAVLDALRDALAGESNEGATGAAKKLGESNAVNAAPVLVEALALGAHPEVAAAALDALAKLRDPKALDVAVLYAGNRSIEVRKAALRALTAIPGDRATEVLMDRLGDAVPDVRETAAKGLEARKETKAADRLFALVRRNDGGAAGPLGTLATPDHIARLAEQQGRVEDRVLATALGEYLKRDDAPDPLRVEVVKTLAKIPGADATTALIEYLAVIPEKDTRPSKAEAQKVVDQRSSAK